MLTFVGSPLVPAPSLEAERAALSQEIEELRAAAVSARLIGAAVGLTIAKHRMTRAHAFDMLRGRSQGANVRLVVIAEEIVGAADRAAVHVE